MSRTTLKNFWSCLVMNPASGGTSAMQASTWRRRAERKVLTNPKRSTEHVVNVCRCAEKPFRAGCTRSAVTTQAFATASRSKQR